MTNILEPIGGSAPKFSLETKITSLVRGTGKELALSCPAQGSPIPTYRCDDLTYLDPVGSSAPKFTVVVPREHSLVASSPGNLHCPAQGSPSPVYRLVSTCFLL